MVEAAWIGWDVGGAHLKGAAVDAQAHVLAAVQRPCTLWRGLEHLERALAEAMEALPGGGAATRHAVTMTGEMVDLFEDRAAGVGALVRALQARLAAAPLFYAGERGFADAAQAASCAEAIASANWRATAEWIARWVARRDGPAASAGALLVDIGSTTSDLVPLRGGRVAAHGRDDFERLVAGELVYSGIVRTPLMALAETVAFEGRQVPLMAEHFATTADVYRLTGELDERADQHAAADGAAKTALASARRLARMIGRDARGGELPRWAALAGALREAQLQRLEQAARRVAADAGLPPGAPVVAAGSGAFLARELAHRLGRPAIAAAEAFEAPGLDPLELSSCAAAAAVASLASLDLGAHP